MFATVFPIISTRDLEGALGFYRDLLGATVSYEFPSPDGKPGSRSSRNRSISRGESGWRGCATPTATSC